MCAVKEKRLEHVFSCMGELATSEVKLIIDDIMPLMLSYGKNKNKKQLMLLTQIKRGLTSSFK